MAFVPMPLKQIPWRIKWMRGTAAFASAPLKTSLKLAHWTAMEIFSKRLAFRTRNLPFVTMPNNFCGLWSFVGDEFEDDLLNFVDSTVKPGDVFVDVGANIGIYSVHASIAAGLAGRVISFEAHPLTAQVFRENIELNRATNITVVNAAVGAEAGSLDLLYGRGDSGSTHVAVKADRSTVSVPVVTLDAKLAEMGVTRIDYLKIDVEGFELYVLRGARATIVANPGIIIQTEIDRRHLSRYGMTPDDVFALLRETGLKPHKVLGDGSLAAIDHADYGDVIWQHAPDTCPPRQG